MGVLDGNDYGNELKEKKWRIMKCKEVFKVVQSDYFSYVHCYNISSNYEKRVIHSISNLVEFPGHWGAFILFIDPYDHCLILNYTISYLIKDFDGIGGID